MKKNPAWISCTSSTIASYRWNPNSPYPLQVRYKSRGGDPRQSSPYGYAAPQDKYQGLVDAPSKGEYIDAEIKKGGYSYIKLSGEGAV